MIDMCLCSHCARIFPQKELREYSMPMLQYKISTLPSRDMMADKSKDILTVKKRLCPQCREELAELVWRWSTYGWEDEENSHSD
jgi:hypothetical protein